MENLAQSAEDQVGEQVDESEVNKSASSDSASGTFENPVCLFLFISRPSHCIWFLG